MKGGDEPVITVHVSKDIQPETLEALGQMMVALIKQLDKKEESNDNIRAKRQRQKEHRK
jgi:hypothetical protein